MDYTAAVLHVFGQNLPLDIEERLFPLVIKWHIILLRIIHMTMCEDVLQQARPRKRLEQAREHM